MYISENISKDYPSFDVSQKVEDVYGTISAFGYSHVFVTKKGTYQGALSLETLEESPGKKVADLMVHAERFAVLNESSMLDSVKLFYTFNANVVPVLDENEKYLGYLCIDDVLGEFSKYPIFSETSALLIIETSAKTYSMTEIAKIVESNHAKFYGAFINKMNEDIVQVTMRISNDNLSSVDETLDRYGYAVVHKFYSDEKEDLLKDRYQFFQKYLEL